MSHDEATTTQERSRWAEYLPLDEIQSAPTNPKLHSAHIGSSIDRFGFADAPILDERTQRLVAGHGRLEQLRRMREEGQEPPEGVRLLDDGSWAVLVQRGWESRSDAEAEAFLLAHNQLTTAGGWDTPELSRMLEGLREEHGFDLLELGWNEQELEALLTESIMDMGGDEGGDGFAEGEQFNEGERLLIEIEVTKERFDSNNFKGALTAWCDSMGLSYKAKSK